MILMRLFRYISASYIEVMAQCAFEGKACMLMWPKSS